jgi:hypothetical protein
MGTLLGAILLLALGLPPLLVALGFFGRALWTGTRLPDPPAGTAADRRVPAALVAFLAESAATATVLLLWLPGLLPWPGGRLPGPLPQGRRPVLLLPGYGMTCGVLWPLARRLRRAGLDAVLSWAPAPLSDIPSAAARLGLHLRHVSSSAVGERVDVVAFGASALLLAESLALDPDLPLGRLVCVAAPWRGSPMSVFWPGPGAPPLLPDRPQLQYWREILHEVLARPLLPRSGAAPGPDALAARWVAVTACDDPWVPGSSGDVPDGSAAVIVPLCGHLRLLLSPVAAAAVARALRPLPAGAPA